VSPVKYELGFYIPEDDILHSHCRENLKCYIVLGCSPVQLHNLEVAGSFHVDASLISSACPGRPRCVFTSQFCILFLHNPHCKQTVVFPKQISVAFSSQGNYTDRPIAVVGVVGEVVPRSVMVLRGQRNGFLRPLISVY
jgi:hypothetical protein